MASSYGSEVVSMLLESGVETEIRDNDGRTPADILAIVHGYRADSLTGLAHRSLWYFPVER